MSILKPRELSRGLLLFTAITSIISGDSYGFWKACKENGTEVLNELSLYQEQNAHSSAIAMEEV